MTSKRERRKEFQDFVRLIDFGSLPLLDDTVTEVILDETCGPHDTTVTLHETEGITNCPFSILAGDLRYTIREDPLRVSYPSCRDFPSFRHVSTLELSEEVEITDGVFKVFQVKDKTPYILKVVNRPFYQPQYLQNERSMMISSLFRIRSWTWTTTAQTGSTCLSK